MSCREGEWGFVCSEDSKRFFWKEGQRDGMSENTGATEETDTVAERGLVLAQEVKCLPLGGSRGRCVARSTRAKQEPGPTSVSSHLLPVKCVILLLLGLGPWESGWREKKDAKGCGRSTPKKAKLRDQTCPSRKSCAPWQLPLGAVWPAHVVSQHL